MANDNVAKLTILKFFTSSKQRKSEWGWPNPNKFPCLCLAV